MTPCPYCASHDTVVTHRHPIDDRRDHIECMRCHSVFLRLQEPTMDCDEKLYLLNTDDEAAASAGRRIADLLGLAPPASSTPGAASSLFVTPSGPKSHTGLTRLVLTALELAEQP
jgi:hypothetical protein